MLVMPSYQYAGNLFINLVIIHVKFVGCQQMQSSVRVVQIGNLKLINAVCASVPVRIVSHVHPSIWHMLNLITIEINGARSIRIDFLDHNVKFFISELIIKLSQDFPQTCCWNISIAFKMRNIVGLFIYSNSSQTMWRIVSFSSLHDL